METPVNGKPRRRSIRLQGYDYSQVGAYFVTICAQNKNEVFGKIVLDEMVLNEAGFTTKSVWEELPTRFPEIELDEFVIMPNHFHGIIVILPYEDFPTYSGDAGRDNPSGKHKVCPYDENPNSTSTLMSSLKPSGKGVGADLVSHNNPRQGVGADLVSARKRTNPLSRIIQAFKSISTNEYIKGVKNKGWPEFPGRLWQRNYFERVIRNEKELDAIRLYIFQNPLKWEIDRENPAGKPSKSTSPWK